MAKNRFLTALAALLFCVLATAQTPKYVFFFIGDGMGINQVYMTDQYNKAMGQEGVNFTSFPTFRAVSTFSANSQVTDSAAAGTALASGTKTNNSTLGNDPEGNSVVKVTELAKAKGVATGVVTSVGINHATPGAFYAHVQSRGSVEHIAYQLLEESRLDFAAGGHFITGKDSLGLKAEDWVAKAKECGFEVYQGKGAYKPTSKRVIYLGDNGDNSLTYAIDRSEGETELSDFTAAAIEHLSAVGKKGFFLMVEGGKIDYSCHANDAATTVAEVNDFTKSVGLAIEFAAKHPKETLIIVTADHETGGCTIGAGGYQFLPSYLQYQKCSKDELTKKLFQLSKNEEIVSWPSVRKVLEENLGLWSNVEVKEEGQKILTQLYKETFLDGKHEEERNLYSSNSRLASEAVKYLQTSRARASWSFGSHSGAPVGLWVWGAASQQFNSCNDNTDIPLTIEKVARYQ